VLWFPCCEIEIIELLSITRICVSISTDAWRPQMWDPHGLTNKKHECLTKLIKETLGIYRFIFLKGGESNVQRSLSGKYTCKARNMTVLSALSIALNL